jgi:hypothetical protein
MCRIRQLQPAVRKAQLAPAGQKHKVRSAVGVEKFSMRSAAINEARDAGNIAVLREIAEGPTALLQGKAGRSGHRPGQPGRRSPQALRGSKSRSSPASVR